MASASGNKTYSSPMRKLVRFFEKSRDQWKAKHHQLKADLKRRENRVRFLEQSQAQWKRRAKAAEAEVARLQAQARSLEEEVAGLKKSE
jgi:chromosome segregation ATPase